MSLGLCRYHDKVKLLNTVEKPLVSSVEEVISRAVVLDGRRVADIGCGRGGLVRWLAGHAAEVAGVECQPELVEQARARQPVAGERYLEGRGEAMPLDDASLDLVIFSYSLHHVPPEAMRAALSEAGRVLVDGGEVLVVEPVADGGYFEVMRLVDDETRVRRLALEAVQDVAAHGLRPVAERGWRIHYHFADVEQLKRRLVDVDPSRRDAVAAHAGELERRFLAEGEPVAEGYRFEMEIRSNLLVK